MIGRVSLAALAAMLAISTAHAQIVPAPAPTPNGPDDAGIVVTASRTSDDAGLTLADRDTIARRQPASLIEVLDDMPGIRAFSTGGPSGGSFLTVRGGEPNFTTVLIDGVRLNDPTNSAGGAFDFALLDPLLVDRIEVAPTAASAIHGSDALSGVVQIVTRDPSGTGIRPGAQGWIDSRYGGSGSVSLSGGWNGGGLLAAGGHYDSGDGDPAGTLRRDQLFGSARQAIGGFRLAAMGLYATTHGTGFPEDSGGPLLAIVRTSEQRDADLAFGAVSLTRARDAKVRPSLSLSWSVQHDDTDSPAIASGVLDGVPATIAHDRFSRLEGIASIAADLGQLTLSAGGAVLREAGRSTGSLDFGFPLPVDFAITRVTHSGFAEAALRTTPAITITGAVRYDKLLGGSGDWTGRGSLIWRMTPNGPRLFAHLANGYKRPSLYALGHPLVGNPALKPETSRSIDAGIEIPLAERGRLTVTAFDNRFHDLVDFDPVLFRLVNRDSVGTRGIESAARIKLGGDWTIAGAVTYLSIDSATPLRGRPRWNGNLQAIWTTGPWQVNAVLRGNSDVNDSSIVTGSRVTPGHLAGDGGIAYKWRDHALFRLALRNIGDNRSWDAVGTPAPGRSLRFSIVLN